MATMASRYLRSHGPVTEKDLAGWMNKPLGFTREALALVDGQVVREELDGDVWLSHVDAREPAGPAGVHLLPQWDEFLLGFKSRHVTLPPEHLAKVVPGRNMVFKPTLVIDGEVAGTWRRRVPRPSQVRVEVTPFGPLAERRWREVDGAAAAYGRFLGAEVEVVRVEGD
jgi:hypothetical protein